MDTNKIVELLFYTLPALVTGGVAYYFFLTFTRNEENKRRFLLRRTNQKTALPLRLQAYERMALLMERISLTKLLIRIAPISTNKNDYADLLVAHIEQEFDHNLTQQIYMSDECWTIIITAKNTTMQIIRSAARNENVSNADGLRELILQELLEKQSPSNTALAFIKEEVKSFL